jgi:hypothetical protein
MRQSMTLARSIAGFLGLLLLPSHLAYAIFPWPVASTTCETCAYIMWKTGASTSATYGGSYGSTGTSQVNYGLTSAYGSSTALDTTQVYYHAKLITGLTPGTTYHYQVVSIDPNNNTASSADYTFTTLPSPTGTVLTVGSGKTYSIIGACISAATAGNTCEVYASGTSPSGSGALSPSGYDSNVSVSKSGSSGSPITIEAHDAVVVAAFTFSSGTSYVTIEGFEVSTTAFSDFSNCTSQVNAFATNQSPHLTISDNYVHNIYYGEFVREGPNPPSKSNYLQLLNNIMAFTVITNTNPPYSYPCASSGGPLFGTNEGLSGIAVNGDHNLYDGNYLTEADHIFVSSGASDIYRRNVMFDTFAADWGAAATADHIDFFHPSSQLGSFPQHMQHFVFENNQEYNDNASNEHFYQASGCGDQSANQIGTGDGSTKTFSGTLSLTNSQGADTGIAPFSVAIAVNASNLGCSGSQYGQVSAIAVDDGFGTLVSTPGRSDVSSGTVNYSTGAYSVTFASAPGSGIPITAYWDLLNYGSHDVIVRFNTAHQVGSGFAGPSYGGTPGMRIYNNTIYYVGYEGTSNPSSSTGGNSYVGLSDANSHWADFNNLYDNSYYYPFRPSWGQITILSPPARTPDYALAYTTPCIPSGNPPCSYGSNGPGTHGVVNQDPLFANGIGYDFSLQRGSPALNAGTYLITVASTDSGSGTSLIVNDAGFFQDGYGIPGVNADCISVTTVVNHVCITAVNYQTNTLTLASSITRSAGDPVWLYSDSTGRQVLFGSAPNIGATFDPPGSPPAPPTSLRAVPH